MSLLAAISFPPFVFENNHFAGFALLDDPGRYCSAIQRRLSDADGIPIGNHQNLVERNRTSHLTGYFFDPQDLSLADLVLFAARGHYRIHLAGLLYNRNHFSVNAESRKYGRFVGLCQEKTAAAKPTLCSYPRRNGHFKVDTTRPIDYINEENTPIRTTGPG